MDERTEPPLRIVRGAPDSTELAAVLLALLSLARQADDDAGPAAAPPPRALWRPAHGWRPPGSWTAP
ncbi:acyl-CoA carboxylase epsilon subunit [Streptomyces erythrochromogenes]|uniref:acyl-CoA carboxylase epsilon subunit n=1 Tax=Streptomyces erythrochromogenes TaxID=285574 RepID=UPI003698A338